MKTALQRELEEKEWRRNHVDKDELEHTALPEQCTCGHTRLEHDELTLVCRRCLACNHFTQAGEALEPDEDEKFVKGLLKKSKPASSWWQASDSYYRLHSHKPKKIIDGKTWSVWGASLHQAKDEKRAFDVIVNCTGNSIVHHGHQLPSELAHFATPHKVDEVLLDWPDRCAIDLPPRFWAELADYLQARQAKTLVHCVGGHGRTGTALACLLVARCGKTGQEAIDFVRKIYCKEAVESRAQEEYIHRVYDSFRKKTKKGGK